MAANTKTITIMAKARWADGLRRGSTKTKTYSTLSTMKEGRIQIVKDRVYDVSNPQSNAQMRQRVAFSTVTIAAAAMAELVDISFEGITKKADSRQKFISLNVARLKDFSKDTSAVKALFNPKGVKLLVPNSYILSQGSLVAPSFLLPQLENSGESFGDSTFADVARTVVVPAGTYTVAQLWNRLWNLLPGDQLTFPQIVALAGEASHVLSLTNPQTGATVYMDMMRNTSYAAPRIVLLSEMPSDTLAITNATTANEIREHLAKGLDITNSWWDNVTCPLIDVQVSATGTDLNISHVGGSYDEVFGVTNDDDILAMGCILSRIVNNAWKYSNSEFIVAWEAITGKTPSEPGMYAGWRFANALQTYIKAQTSVGEGNFLQHGESLTNVVPESFM